MSTTAALPTAIAIQSGFRNFYATLKTGTIDPKALTPLQTNWAAHNN